MTTDTPRPGQLTMADYLRLDRLDPSLLTPAYRVKTTHPPRGVCEYLGTDREGHLVRAAIDTACYTRADQAGVWAAWRHLPYLRLVDEHTGHSFSDPEGTPRATERTTS